MYFEGACMVHHLGSNASKQLVEEFAVELMEVRTKITHQMMARLTQAIVACNVPINSPTLCALLESYIKDNVSEKDFPKETRMNLTRIADLTGLNKYVLKDSL